MAVDYYIMGSSWHAVERKSVVEKINRFWEWPTPSPRLQVSSWGQWEVLALCRAVFNWCEQSELWGCASPLPQHLFCLLFTLLLLCFRSDGVYLPPHALMHLQRSGVFFFLSNKESARLISNEPTLGLVMWIGKPRVDAASRASGSLPLSHSGQTNCIPKEGWGWML